MKKYVIILLIIPFLFISTAYAEPFESPNTITLQATIIPIHYDYMIEKSPYTYIENGYMCKPNPMNPEIVVNPPKLPDLPEPRPTPETQQQQPVECETVTIVECDKQKQCRVVTITICKDAPPPPPIPARMILN